MKDKKISMNDFIDFDRLCKSEFLFISLLPLLANKLISFFLVHILLDKERKRWWIFPLIISATYNYFFNFINSHNYFMLFLGAVIWTIPVIFICAMLSFAFTWPDTLGELVLEKIIERPDPRNFMHRLTHAVLALLISIPVIYILDLGISDNHCTAFYRGTCI